VKHFALTLAAVALALPMAGTAADQKTPPPNPEIDMAGHIKLTQEAAKHRETRRVSEEDFIRMSKEPGTIILDARSKAMYDLLHVTGAINLTFPDISIDSVAKTIPDMNTRVLIYCNNNFKNSPIAFAPKSAALSLNLSTYTTLYGYGYRNVYELAPLVDPKESKLTFESNAKQ
jgi:phage shock protein E